MKNDFTWIELLKFWAIRLIIAIIIAIIWVSILYFKYR
jgi:hypothetical protein